GWRGRRSRRCSCACLPGQPADRDVVVVGVEVNTDRAATDLPGSDQGGAAAGERVQYGAVLRASGGNATPRQLEGEAGVMLVPTRPGPHRPYVTGIAPARVACWFRVESVGCVYRPSGPVHGRGVTAGTLVARGRVGFTYRVQIEKVSTLLDQQEQQFVSLGRPIGHRFGHGVGFVPHDR